jgi:hypothetical protein
MCTRQSCPLLSSPPNGRVVFDDFANPSLATYTCNTGYILLGDVHRNCLPGRGQWSGIEPTCLMVPSCPYILPPFSGDVSVRNDTHMVFTCWYGYGLVGERVLTCLETGQWSGPAPRCVRDQCYRLYPPSGGQVSVPSLKVSSVATYSCHRRWKLVGGRIRTCQSDLTWSGKEPYCEIDLSSVTPECLGVRCTDGRCIEVDEDCYSFETPSVPDTSAVPITVGEDLIPILSFTCSPFPLRSKCLPYA